MALLKKILIRLSFAILGILAGLIFIEVLLHLIPKTTFRRMFSYRPYRYDFLQEDRDIGWVHVPNASILSPSKGEFEVTVHINSKGLRDVEREYAKPPGTLRVLMLGDSFVEAAQVEMEQNMSSRLQTCLAERLDRPVEVINTGVSFYGPGDELVFLQSEGLKYQPDLVLTGFFVGNDFENIQHKEYDSMFLTFGGYRYKLEEGELVCYWVSWEEPEEGDASPVETWLRRHSRIWYILKHPESKLYRNYIDEWEEQWARGIFGRAASAQAGETETGKPRPPWHTYVYVRDFPNNPAVPEETLYVWELLQAIMEETRAQAQASGAQYGVFLIPEIAQIDQDAYQARVSKLFRKYDMLSVAAWDVAAPNKAMVEMLNAKGIPVLDLFPALVAHAANSNEPSYFAKDYHFTPEGHRVTAELLCDWVIDNQMIGP